jgi:hypothetical protein
MNTPYQATEPQDTAQDEGAQNIIQTLMKVMQSVRAVGKDGYNKGQNFPFRGIDGVMNAVGPAMREHGLVAIPTVVDKEVEYGATGSNKKMTIIRLTVDYTFLNLNGDSLTSRVVSEANDTADKATAKAMSVAFRTCLLQVLALPTQDKDPDEDFNEQHYPRPQAPAPAPMPDNWKELVAGAEERLAYQQLQAMEQSAMASGNAEARSVIATARLRVKKALEDQQKAHQAPQGDGEGKGEDKPQAPATQAAPAEHGSMGHQAPLPQGEMNQMEQERREAMKQQAGE